MKDPFPIPPIPILSRAVQPIADKYGLFSLPFHIHEVLGAALLYTFIHIYVSPWISKKYFPKYYPTDRNKRVNWDTHVVSIFQSVLVCAVALYVNHYDEERKNMDWEQRVWGYTGASSLVQSMAAGYFIWDFVTTVLFFNVFGIGLLAHAVSALLVYSFGFRPFLNYYSTVFILYELSTPFLNIHWFCDKLDMTGSNLQLYNGFFLLGSFFFARLVWGMTQSVYMWHDMWRALSTSPSTEYMSVTSVNEKMPLGTEDVMLYAKDATVIPVWLFAVYFLSNITLNVLNVYWFEKMIKAIRKRFQSPAEKEKVPAYEHTQQKTTGADEKKATTDHLRQRNVTAMPVEVPVGP